MANVKTKGKKKTVKKVKTVVKTQRKKLWATRDTGSTAIEIHRKKPQQSEKQSYEYNVDSGLYEFMPCGVRFDTEDGAAFELCVIGFARATGLTLKEGTCAQIAVTLTTTK